MLYDMLVSFGILMLSFTALVMLSIGVDDFFGKHKTSVKKRRVKSEKVKQVRKNTNNRSVH